LIENFNLPEYQAVLNEMAGILSTPADDFHRLWLDTFPQRTTGVHGTQKESIEYICRELNIEVSDEQVARAFDVRLDYTRRAVIPRAGALEVLEKLKSRGYPTALISDCSGEIPLIWKETPFAPLFDVAVFSCIARVKKPDPRIYHMATEQLNVQPGDCLYIGDGSSQELTGARAVGMHPVLIRVPDESADAHFIDREKAWDGPEISSLLEVLDMVGC
jgi:putative hydrolase of the HAD superfamily